MNCFLKKKHKYLCKERNDQECKRCMFEELGDWVLMVDRNAFWVHKIFVYSLVSTLSWSKGPLKFYTSKKSLLPNFTLYGALKHFILFLVVFFDILSLKVFMQLSFIENIKYVMAGLFLSSSDSLNVLYAILY